MSDDTTCDEVTLEGQTLTTGDYLYTEQQFAHIPAGIYMQVDGLYEMEDGANDVYAYIREESYANGVGSEFDGPALVICRALNKGKLSRKKYDPQMHD